VLIALGAVAATAFVGSSIVVATIVGPPSGRRPAPAQTSPYDAAAVATKPPAAGWVHRRLTGSPPPLAALHRQGAALLGPDLEASLRRLRGYPVVLNAWASWCGPCREELPLMARESARFGRRVAFVGADVDDSSTAARTLIGSDPLSYPSYRVSAPTVRAIAPIIGFPTTIYLDRRGHLVASHQGQYATAGELAADVRRYALRR
jgi:thiol-disulfide isomerase/thioredoxin